MYFTFLFGRIHFFPKKIHSLVKIQWIRYSSEMKHYSPLKIIIPFMIILMLYFKQAYENNYISSCRPNICFQEKNVNFESSQISFVFHPEWLLVFWLLLSLLFWTFTFKRILAVKILFVLFWILIILLSRISCF